MQEIRGGEEETEKALLIFTRRAGAECGMIDEEEGEGEGEGEGAVRRLQERHGIMYVYHYITSHNIHIP